MEETDKNLSDYLAMARRHKRGMVIVAGIIMGIGLLFARYLPATYQSSATILVEQQEIPIELVQSTVTSMAAERIQSISQRVMTRRNLLRIMSDTGLYEDRRKRETAEAVIQRMRENISLDMVEGSVSGSFGRQVTATIAFSISFTGEKPTLIQKVTNQFSSLYLNENLKERAQAATETVRFLESETKRLRDQIDVLGSRLVKFKIENRTSLPELSSLNQQLLSTSEEILTRFQESRRAAQNQISLLKEELSLTDPYGTDSAEVDSQDPAVRLQQMRTQLQSLEGVYAAQHPSITRLNRMIATLEDQFGLEASEATTTDNSAAHTSLVEQLDAARARYNEGHPDIVRLTKAIEKLDESSASMETSAESTPSSRLKNDIKPTSLRYRSLQRNIENIEHNINEINVRMQRAIDRHSDIEQRLVKTPQISRDYTELNYRYEISLKQLHDVEIKLEAARLGQTLEKELKGERFTLIEPANRPEEPISPNRPMIVILSVLLASICAAGYTVALESLDSSVRGAKDVRRILNVAPMAVVPFQFLEQHTSKLRRKKWLIGLLLFVVLIVLIALYHFYVTPLDIFWFRSLRKIGILLGIDLV